MELRLLVALAIKIITLQFRVIPILLWLAVAVLIPILYPVAL